MALNKTDKNIIFAIILLIILYFSIILFLIKACSADYTYEYNFLLKYIMDTNNNITENAASNITNEILYQSEHELISWKIITAIMKVESHFNIYAVSEKNAKGLMQIYTLECNDIKINPNKLFEIKYNIACGICIFKEKIKEANNDIELAIMLYNGRGEITKKYLKEVKETLKHIIKTFNSKVIIYEKNL